MDHVAGYWDHRNDKNMLFLLFEDMLQVANLLVLSGVSHALRSVVVIGCDMTDKV